MGRLAVRAGWRNRCAVLAGSVLSAFALAPAAGAAPANGPDSTWAPNGRVSAIVQVGDTVYLGGSFTQLVENGGAGPGVVSRDRLAAIDAATGTPTAWAPQADDEVYSLAASPDGARIYAGGRFTNVDGAPRSRLAAIAADGTGSVEPGWKAPTVSASVLTLAATSGKLYAGGYFSTVGGQPRSRLAAFAAAGGALDESWRPSVNAAVRTLALSVDGASVFAGGDFASTSGAPRANAAALDAATGAVDGWSPDPGATVHSLAAVGSTVYAGLGGNRAGVAAWNAADGAWRWQRRSSGDVHAVAASGDALYAGGHGYYFDGERRGQLVGLARADGTLLRDWAPDVGGTAWGGVWALSAHGTQRLAAGGDFDRVLGAKQNHYAQWAGPIGTAGAPSAQRAASGAQGGRKDTVAPRVTGFSLARSAFPVASSPTPVAAKRRRRARGSTFRYRLSEPSAVRVTIERVLPGRRIRGRCVRPSRKRPRARRCLRYTRVGSLSRTGRAGSNRLPFSGRIGRRALRTGRYRATLVATDAAGNRSARKRLRFRIVKR